MHDSQPPARDGIDCDVDAEETLPSRAFRDERGFEVDSPLPQYIGDDNPGLTARSQTTRRSRMFLALGVAFEVFATCWAFQTAVAAGALYRFRDCSYDGRLARLYVTSRIVKYCDGPVDADMFYNFVDKERRRHNASYLDGFAACDYLTDVPTGDNIFDERCSYTDDTFGSEPCSWVTLSSSSDRFCFAQGMLTNSSDGTVTSVFDDHSAYSCLPTHPFGTVELTITAFVVALISELLEAFVGFKYWKDTATETAPTLAASVFEALGVVAVSAVLISNPEVFVLPQASGDLALAWFWSAWTIGALVIVGALAEVVAGCSDRAAGRLPYLGAVGNALIWLGAALLEVLVTVYLLWASTGTVDVATVAREVFGLFVLELLGLVFMWIARGLWTRSKLLRSSVKSLGGPMREAVCATRRQFK